MLETWPSASLDYNAGKLFKRSLDDLVMNELCKIVKKDFNLVLDLMNKLKCI